MKKYIKLAFVKKHLTFLTFLTGRYKTMNNKILHELIIFKGKEKKLTFLTNQLVS